MSEESKGYKLYDRKWKKVVISRDVVFEESQGWNWNDSENTQSSSYLIDNDVIEFTADEPLNQTDTEVPQLDDIRVKLTLQIMIMLFLIMKKKLKLSHLKKYCFPLEQEIHQVI